MKRFYNGGYLKHPISFDTIDSKNTTPHVNNELQFFIEKNTLEAIFKLILYTNILSVGWPSYPYINEAVAKSYTIVTRLVRISGFGTLISW